MALEESGGSMYMPVAPAYGNGGGFGGFGDGWWIILLFLVFGGAWGGMGGFGGGDVYPWLNNSQNINDGFRDQYLMTTVSGIGDSINSGFAGLNAAISQQNFNLQSQLAQCCCDNRLASADLKYTIATENCADRAAIADGLREVISATQAQTQTILDKMCADKIDAKNEQIWMLQNRINSLESNNYLQNALTAQTQYFLERYPVPAPAAFAV